MNLKISALRYKGQSLQSPISALFDEQGGTIGRSPGNRCVLPDEQKVVSGRHATILFDAGCFYYLDESLNGTRFCTGDRLIHHEKIALKDQDELRIGDYDLIVAISASRNESRLTNADISFLSMFDNDASADQGALQSSDSGTDTSDIFFPEKDFPGSRFQGHVLGDRDVGPEINESFSPPRPVAQSPQAPGLPRDLSMQDFFGDDFSGGKFFEEDIPGEENNIDEDIVDDEHVEEIARSLPFSCPQGQVSQELTEIVHAPSVKPVKRPSIISKLLEKQSAEVPERPVSSQRSAPVRRIDEQRALELMDVFMDAIGLQDSKDSLGANDPEFMRNTGEVFKELVQGLITILRGRSALKSQLRVSMTVVKKDENNPLKFSPSVEDALKILLAGKCPGYISGVEAIRECFEDIKNHQLATTAGVQASLMHILKRFDPANFEKKNGKGLELQKKSRCWNEYSQTYQDNVQAALDDFFGEHFVKAYEAQMEKLRQHHKKRGR